MQRAKPITILNRKFARLRYRPFVQQKDSDITMIPAFKRSRSDQPPPSSPWSIDNLHDLVLIEILCRLHDSKLVIGCKLVSKRWRSLLSDPYFINRFLRIRHDQHKPLLNQLFRLKNQYAISVLTMSSEPLLPHPPLETAQTSILSIIPYLESRHYTDFRYEGNNLHVEGTYNDLVLCSHSYYPRVYYICNFYTKEWIRLIPPTPRILLPDEEITTGFICEPYYNIKDECPSSNSSEIKLQADYRFRVVRLITTYVVNDERNRWRVIAEIFSSETGKWREYSLSCQQPRCVYFTTPGIGCNGKLYWWTYDDSIFELDPFSMCSYSDVVIDKCRYIQSPTPADTYASVWYIGVCQGRLQICPCYIRRPDDPMAIWELKENEVDDEPEWCFLHQINLSQMVPKQLPFIISRFCIVGFHPGHGDIVYLQHVEEDSGLRYIVMCNVREKTLEIAAIEMGSRLTEPFIDYHFIPYVIPWWPTPIPTRLDYQEEYFNITVTGGADIIILKVCTLTTVEKLKQELDEKKGHCQLFYDLHFDGKVLRDEKWLTDYGIKDNSNITLEKWEEWKMCGALH